MNNDIVSIIADGLDECVDGSGWGPKHQVAANFANASPLLIAACRAAIDQLPAGTAARDLCLAAIAVANRGETPPAYSTPLEDLQKLVAETVAGDVAELAQQGKHRDFIEARKSQGLLALDYLASLR